jgi:hypothetical protein
VPNVPNATTTPRQRLKQLLAVHRSGFALFRSVDNRGPIALNAGARVDEAGMAAAERAGFDVRWHADQGGWLGAAVLVDVHPARRRCCKPWGHSGRADKPCYHWVFRGAARLALPTWGRGFTGLRPVSWSVLVRRRALGLLPREQR